MPFLGAVPGAPVTGACPLPATLGKGGGLARHAGSVPVARARSPSRPAGTRARRPAPRTPAPPASASPGRSPTAGAAAPARGQSAATTREPGSAAGGRRSATVAGARSGADPSRDPCPMPCPRLVTGHRKAGQGLPVGGGRHALSLSAVLYPPRAAAAPSQGVIRVGLTGVLRSDLHGIRDVVSLVPPAATDANTTGCTAGGSQSVPRESDLNGRRHQHRAPSRRARARASRQPIATRGRAPQRVTEWAAR